MAKKKPEIDMYGPLLKSVMEMKGMTIPQLVLAIGNATGKLIPPERLVKIYSGRQGITTTTMRTIAAGHGMTPEAMAILFGELLVQQTKKGGARG